MAKEDVPPALSVTLLALLVAVPVVCWTPCLLWGLQLDETFSAWQAEGGWAILRTKLENPGQSVLFGYIEALFYFPHASSMELALRLPSVLGTLASAFLIHRLAESFVGEGAGAMALVPFLCNPYLLRFTCEARPYTLAMSACLASLWGLRRWLEEGMRRHLLLFSVALALIPYLHLMYVGFGFVLLALVALRVSQGGRVDWRGLGGALALTAVLLLPLVPFVRDFAARRAGLSFKDLPTTSDLLEAWAPWTVLLGTFGLLLVAIVLGKRTLAIDRDRGRDVVVLALVWLLAPPLLLFVASHITHESVLIHRYFLHTVAAQALLVAFLYARIPRALARVVLLACFLPLPLIFGVRDWGRTDGFNSYRAPFAAARALDPAGAAPLFLQAGHPLSNRIDWQHEEPRLSYHYSPLAAYPVSNRVYPLPAAVDAAVESFMRDLANGALARSELILFVGGSALAEWLRTFFEARGYKGTYALREGLCLLALRR